VKINAGELHLQLAKNLCGVAKIYERRTERLHCRRNAAGAARR
jgi:hypothetical protein